MKTIFVLLLALSTIGCGYSKNHGTPGGMPAISGLMPPSTTAGGMAFNLTVSGSNFTTSSVVYWVPMGGVAAPRSTTCVMAPNQCVAQILMSDIVSPGTAGVYVRNAGGAYGSGVNSNTMNFTITP